MKKPLVPWSEESDFKTDPELRWRALARQSLFGDNWLRLRRYQCAPEGRPHGSLLPALMEREYRRLQSRLAASSASR